MLEFLFLVNLHTLGRTTPEMAVILQNIAYSFLQFHWVLGILKGIAYWFEHTFSLLTLELLHSIEIETITDEGHKHKHKEDKPPCLVEIRMDYHFNTCHIALVVRKGREALHLKGVFTRRQISVAY